MSYLRQHSRYCDLRHLKALGWMVSALICSGQLNLAAWTCRRAQSPKHRAAVAEIHEQRIQVEALYLPLVMAALSGWQQSGSIWH